MIVPEEICQTHTVSAFNLQITLHTYTQGIHKNQHCLLIFSLSSSVHSLYFLPLSSLDFLLWMSAPVLCQCHLRLAALIWWGPLLPQAPGHGGQEHPVWHASFLSTMLSQSLLGLGGELGGLWYLRAQHDKLDMRGNCCEHCCCRQTGIFGSHSCRSELTLCMCVWVFVCLPLCVCVCVCVCVWLHGVCVWLHDQLCMTTHLRMCGCVWLYDQPYWPGDVFSL